MKKIILFFSLLLILNGCMKISNEKIDNEILTNLEKEELSSAIQSQKEEQEIVYGKESIIEKENVDIDGRHYEYIKYYFIKENTVGILALKTKNDILIIPNKIFGYSVETVGGELDDEAIEEYNSLYKEDKISYGGQYTWHINKRQNYKKIIIEEGIKNVYSGAFEGVKAKQIILPCSLKGVGWCSFQYAKVIKVVIKGKKTRLGMDAFADSKLKDIKLSDKYKGVIESSCFSGSHIESFTWPDWGNSKNKIEYDCFAECKYLRKIIFPENQEHIYIDDGIFNSCPNLKELEFPASTKKVTYRTGNYADNHKQSVESLIFRGKNTKLMPYGRFEDGSFYYTVGKIVAPRDSKAIKVAKKSKKVGHLSKRYTKHHVDYLEMPTPGILEQCRGVTFVPMEWEEI